MVVPRLVGWSGRSFVATLYVTGATSEMFHEGERRGRSGGAGIRFRKYHEVRGGGKRVGVDAGGENGEGWSDSWEVEDPGGGRGEENVR